VERMFEDGQEEDKIVRELEGEGDRKMSRSD
jgi:hypothetical protein